MFGIADTFTAKLKPANKMMTYVKVLNLDMGLW